MYHVAYFCRNLLGGNRSLDFGDGRVKAVAPAGLNGHGQHRWPEVSGAPGAMRVATSLE
jgi:hypothetical protein